MKVYRVTISYDQSIENPQENPESWKFYRFNRRHSNHVEPSKSIRDKAKFHAGLAHILSYYKRSPSELGAESIEDRDRACIEALREYTAWYNGECYSYSIDLADVTEREWEDGDVRENSWKRVGDCGGLIGRDWLMEFVLAALPNDATTKNTIGAGLLDDVGELFPRQVEKH